MNKKFLVLAAVMIAFIGFVSCDEEDETTYVSPNYLAGKWTLTEKGTLNAQNVLNYAPVDNEGCIADEVTFNENFSFNTSYADFDGTNCTTISEDGMYEYIPGNVVFKYADENPADEIPGETVTMTLKTLSDIELVLVTTDVNEDVVFLKFTKVTE